jgi:fatty-acid desaturase
MKKLLVTNTPTAQAILVFSILAGIVGFYIYGFTLGTVGLSLLGYFLYVCLGVSVTFHRNLCHKSYKTHPWITKFFSFLGCMANTGSSIVWVSIHTKHHLKSDKPGDPHSPRISGWKIFLLDYPVDDDIKWRMRDLIVDRYHQFLHRYYFAILAAYSLFLFLIGGWYLVIFFHWVPIVLAAVMSNLLNYAGHKSNWWGGYRRYNLSDDSSNNWIWALPSFGEGWHNNHHRHPKNFSCGEKWWEFDISAWVIRLIRT